jgi:tetratricopeptide (TPR) repeat protein
MTAVWRAIVGAIVLATAWAQVALAAGPATMRDMDGFARLELRLPEGAGPARSQIASDVLVVRLAAPVDIDAASLAAAAPAYVAMARLDPDRRALRIALKKPLRLRQTNQPGVQILDLIPAAAPDPEPPAAVAATAPAATTTPPAGAPRAVVTISRAPEFVRVAIPAPGAYAFNHTGRRVSLRFARPVAFSLVEATAAAPQEVARLARSYEPGASILRFEAPQGATVRHRREGGTVFVDILKAAPADQPQAAAATPPAPAAAAQGQTAAAEPAAAKAGTGAAVVADAAANAPAFPAGAVVATTARTQGRDLVLTLPMPVDTPGAVFRRGDGVWILFPVDADVRPPAAGTLGPAVSGVQPVRAKGVSGLRLTAAGGQRPVVEAAGQSWRIRLTDRNAPPSRRVEVRRDADAGGSSRLVAMLPGAEAVAWVDDAAVGDRFAVGFARGPTTGVVADRLFLEASLPVTAHGVLVLSRTDDLDVRLGLDQVAIGRPQGLALTGAQVAEARNATAGFVDFAGGRGGGPETFMSRLAALQAAAAIEDEGPGSPTEARFALARFLMAGELAPEALGVIRALVRTEPKLDNSPALRAMRGAANAMMGRSVEARSDFVNADFDADPASALWAGYAAAAASDHTEAMRLFETGAAALPAFADDWAARFLTAKAESALQLGDAEAARNAIAEALRRARAPEVLLPARLIEAQLKARAGDTEAALGAYAALARAGYEPVAARAAFELTTLQASAGKIPPTQAINQLETMLFRWRGDDLELDMLHELGKLYLANGRTAEGLATMQGGATLRPDLPSARALRDTMASEFRKLFLEGGADAMDPLQALALFYDFRGLTPVGPDGDLMIRGLADRLVSFDLLPQAAELLQHQADNRLEGFARAQVATDLAAIYLMDRRPEQALKALDESRQTQLPEALNQQRRLLMAAGLSQTGRSEQALEILSEVDGPDAARLTADIHWRSQDWSAAAAALDAVLPAPGVALSPERALDVLRAGAARALAGDVQGLTALQARYGSAMAATTEGDAFAAMTPPRPGAPGDLEQAVRAAGDTSAYERLLQRARRGAQAVAQGGATTPAPGRPRDGAPAPTRAAQAAPPRTGTGARAG